MGSGASSGQQDNRRVSLKCVMLTLNLCTLDGNQLLTLNLGGRLAVADAVVAERGPPCLCGGFPPGGLTLGGRGVAGVRRPTFAARGRIPAPSPAV